jgi:hypothetical protein
MTEALASPRIHHLSSEDRNGRVWVSDRGWTKLCTAAQVVEAVRFLHGSDRTSAQTVNEQLDNLTSVLQSWLSTRRDQIGEAYLQVTDSGRLTLVVVQKGRAFNRAVTDDVAQLELDLATDDRFQLLRVDAEIAPGPRLVAGE